MRRVVVPIMLKASNNAAERHRGGVDGWPIVVVATNHGATHEAVQEIWLQYAEHGPVDRAQGAPSVRVTQIAAPELPPNRNVRVTIDLLGTRRHAPIATGEVTALVVLESGRHVLPRLTYPRSTSSG
jgi:hypothetical protein